MAPWAEFVSVRAALDAGTASPTATPATTGAANALGLVSAALVLITGIGASVFWIGRDQGPPPEAFGPAAEVVRQGWQPGDLLLLVPAYATRAREHLGDLRPVATRTPLAEDFAAHQRVWVFGLFGEGEGLRADLEASGLELEAKASPSPGITVDRYRVKAPATVGYRFVDQLRGAKVMYEQPDGVLEPCDQWTDDNGHGGKGYGRWKCRRDSEWFYVSPEWHRMGDHLRLCLWAHPPNGGRLLIRYPSVPLTGVIHGRAGHTLNGSMHARAPIHLDVHVGSLPHQRYSFGLHEHYRPFALQTPVGTPTLTFAVSTPDAGANHFCFSADVRSHD